MLKVTFLIFFTILYLNGAHCSTFLRSSFFQHSKETHRQTPSSDAQCVLDKFDESYRGNNSLFVAECRSVISLLLEDVFDDSDDSDDSDDYPDEQDQAEANIIFSTLCIPDCGNIVLQAAADCDSLDASEIQYSRALCGVNDNGDTCYEIFLDSFTVFETEINCTISSSSLGMCDCRSELMAGLEEQGCCIDGLHDIAIEILDGRYNPRDIYDTCDVDLPDGCDNNPLSVVSGSIKLMFSFMSALVATVAVMLG